MLNQDRDMNHLGSVHIEVCLSLSSKHNRGISFHFELKIMPKYPYNAPSVFMVGLRGNNQQI